jgi:hypothetical protein
MGEPAMEAGYKEAPPKKGRKRSQKIGYFHDGV